MCKYPLRLSLISGKNFNTYNTLFVIPETSSDMITSLDITSLDMTCAQMPLGNSSVYYIVDSTSNDSMLDLSPA